MSATTLLRLLLGIFSFLVFCFVVLVFRPYNVTTSQQVDLGRITVSLSSTGQSPYGAQNASIAETPTFSVGPENKFWINHKPIKLYSGSFHFWRVPEPYWPSRLQILLDMGLNAVEFYIPWSLAETEREMYPDGDPAHVRFVRLAAEMGIWILLRPGPYICAEFDLGGLPARLVTSDMYPKKHTIISKKEDSELAPHPIRSFSESYISEVQEFWGWLLPPLRKWFWKENLGGTILMAQLENEFGSFGNVLENEADRRYMLFLRDLARKHLGNDTQFFTTDFWDALKKGGINEDDGFGPPVYSVGDFGPEVNGSQSFANMRAANMPGLSPNFVSEYYTGWMTNWMDASVQNKSTQQIIQTMTKNNREMENFNLYMAHGGTNFGFSTGGDVVTTYDYNAPITENGLHGFGSEGLDTFEALKREIGARTSLASVTNSSEGLFDGTKVTGKLSRPVRGMTTDNKEKGHPVTRAYPEVRLTRESRSLKPAYAEGACQTIRPDLSSRWSFVLSNYKVYDHYALFRLVMESNLDDGATTLKMITDADPKSSRDNASVLSNEEIAKDAMPAVKIINMSTTQEKHLAKSSRSDPIEFTISDLRDAVYIYVNGQFALSIDRGTDSPEDTAATNGNPVKIKIESWPVVDVGDDRSVRVDFFYENRGRRNYGLFDMLGDQKGFSLSTDDARIRAGIWSLCTSLFDPILVAHERAIGNDQRKTGTKSDANLRQLDARLNSTATKQEADEIDFVVAHRQMSIIFPDLDKQQIRAFGEKSAVSPLEGHSRRLFRRRKEANSMGDFFSFALENVGDFLGGGPIEFVETGRQPIFPNDGSNVVVESAGAPYLYTGTFTLTPAGKVNGFFPDTFIDTSSFCEVESEKGVVFVNGINLGRYWNAAGPVYSLYLPGVFLKPGTNIVTVVAGYNDDLKNETAIIMRTRDSPKYKMSAH